MVKRTVIWSKTADIQLVGVLEYWVKRNKSNSFSKKLLKLVVERTNQIALEPFIYRPTDFKDVRVMPLGNFSIFYKISQSNIIIVAFWDNRQDPKKLLDIIKKNM